MISFRRVRLFWKFPPRTCSVIESKIIIIIFLPVFATFKTKLAFKGGNLSHTELQNATHSTPLELQDVATVVLPAEVSGFHAPSSERLLTCFKFKAPPHPKLSLIESIVSLVMEFLSEKPQIYASTLKLALGTLPNSHFTTTPINHRNQYGGKALLSTQGYVALAQR